MAKQWKSKQFSCPCGQQFSLIALQQHTCRCGWHYQRMLNGTTQITGRCQVCGEWTRMRDNHLFGTRCCNRCYARLRMAGVRDAAHVPCNFPQENDPPVVIPFRRDLFATSPMFFRALQELTEFEQQLVRAGCS